MSKIQITHTMLADTVVNTHHFFCLDDTLEFYIYQDGVYSNVGSEIKMQKIIREAYHTIYGEIAKRVIAEVAKSQKGDEGASKANEELPAMDAKISLVSETLAKLRADWCMSREELDKIQRNSSVINFKNGVYEIKNGQFQGHRPDMKLIRQLPVLYDPNATCPHTMDFLNKSAPNDLGLLLEIIGYLTIPDTRIQKAVMVYGPPGTGKSIFLKLIEAFIGDSNCSNASLQQLEEDKYRVAELYGMLVNIYPDLREGVLAHDNVFKTVVGGDKLSGERKYQNTFKFQNTARLLFSANEENLPAMKTGDKAFFRRWMLVRFGHIFSGTKDEDISLIKKLTTPSELSGLANLAIAALKTVIKNKGFSYHKTIDEIEQEYTTYSSSAKAFVSQNLVMGTQDIKKIEMYEMYKIWCDKLGLVVVPDNKFGSVMKSMGYKDGRAKASDENGERPMFWNCVDIVDECAIEHGKQILEDIVSGKNTPELTPEEFASW